MPRLFSAKVIFYFFLLAVLDGTVMPVFQIHGVYPSLLYLFVCYAAFEWGFHKTIYIAFWAGLLRDLLGGGLIGLEATIMGLLCFLIVGLIAGWLAGQVMKGGGYGVIVDIVLGILGGIVGGWLFGMLGIWPGGGIIGAIVVAFVGAVFETDVDG